MRKIKLKAQVKPKCNCEDHYLELCTSFDGEIRVSQRYCYKCGKWWTFTEKIELPKSAFIRYDSYHITCGYYEDLYRYFPRTGDVYYCADVNRIYVSIQDGAWTRIRQKEKNLNVR